MDQSLGYLRESLANYIDRSDEGKEIYRKLLHFQEQSEEQFVNELSEQEIQFLNHVLPNEIKYAADEKDYERLHFLNEVYEILY
ncbi:sigma-G-dependent sporulation-specific acid-soluble spore protein CsgA [Metabacillus arenae]|uniref:Sigma-G-dependent sporulation-specific acid-soluble spore protein CsgA n=1 Tax=Metabacillus arenae TaxID=2771434 RepID=A0A926NPF2_9BACI|nr:sigma-G-dependent sporulation-specific acid-soluble spore protein CsgA [Metabacillus arenae]MBD1381657.1 sigma-G-dependent sporulation-specific acid-soluble spore protein CsgA [Metabacillus arenae]